jgi:hypothetical protein
MTLPKSTEVNRLMAGLIIERSEFLSWLTVNAKAILLFLFFYRTLLATSKAFKRSGISMKEKLKKMNLYLRFS